MTARESLEFLGLPEASGREVVTAALQAYERRLQQRAQTAATDEAFAEIDRDRAAFKSAQAALLDPSANAAIPSPLSLTQQRDLPVRAASEVGGLSYTQARDLPVREASITETPHAQVDTEGDAGAPDGGLGLKTADLLAQRYEIRRLMGRGGMGAVFSAFDRVRNEEVAVKVLLPHLLRDAQARERFTNEARLASSLSHPNIVRVYDLQQDGDKTFLTMERLKGISLREEIVRRQGKSQRFAVDEVRRIGEQLCDALSHAHKQTIHRDVKPENIWLCEDGSLRLMDFGIARLLRPSQFTSLGLGMGTAYYMAPEQLKAQKEIDHRADQYAVGVVLYELLTGEIPQGMVKAPREVRKSVPGGLSQAVTKAMAGSPAERFSDMAGLRGALRSQNAGVRVPRWAAVAVVLAIVLGLGGTYPFWIGPVQRQWRIHLAGEAKAQAVSARAKAERAKETWQEKSAGLTAAVPTQVVEAQEKWQIGEEALADLEFGSAATAFASAASGYEQAARSLLAEQVQGQERRKLLDMAQSKLKEVGVPRAEWQRLAKGLTAAEIPPAAVQAEEAYRAAQESAGNWETSHLVSERVGEAIQLYDEATRAVTKLRLSEMAEAKSRARLALDEAQGLLTEMKQAVKNAGQALARAQDQKKQEEIARADAALVTAKRLQEAFEAHPLGAGWHDEANGALAAGDALVKDDLVAARAKYEHAEAAAKKLTIWLTHAPKALAEVYRLGPLVAARVKEPSDPKTSLYAWPVSLLKGAWAKIQEADPRLAFAETQRVDEALADVPKVLSARLSTLAYQNIPRLKEALSLVGTKIAEADDAVRTGRLEEARKFYKEASARYDAIAAVAAVEVRIEAAELATRRAVQVDLKADPYAWPRTLLGLAPAILQQLDASSSFDLVRQIDATLPKIDGVLRRRPEDFSKGVIAVDEKVAVAISDMNARLTEGDAALRSGKISEADDLYREAFRLMPFLKSPFSAATAAAKQQQWAGESGVRAVETNSLGMKLAFIPHGDFLMGSPATESDHGSNEKQHPVRIASPFYLGVHEVTQSEFQRVTGRNPAWFNPAGGGKNTLSGQDTGKFPAERVSWYDAVEFCNQLSKRESLSEFYSLGSVTRKDGLIVSATVTVSGGKGYRLPTEAEWEFACRAGTTTPFAGGAVFGGREANVNGKYPYGTSTAGTYLRRTTTVGAYAANAFGLNDMHGNVWEWCFDRYQHDYGISSAEIDPIGPASGTFRVLRGGSWYDFAALVRSGYRFRDAPDYRINYIGFRVARSLDRPSTVVRENRALSSR